LIGAESAALACSTLGQLAVDYAPFGPIAKRVWQLRNNLTAYDAFYVALAEALDAPLATLDQRLAAAPGPTCRFITPNRD
jgi:predicted nucleic acid-binding protein